MTDAPITNRIRELRERLGMTQEDLADEAGLSATYISRLERGERNLNTKTMARIAKALKVEPVELLDVSRAYLEIDIQAFITENHEVLSVIAADKKRRNMVANIPAAYAQHEVALVVGNHMSPRANDGDIIVYVWHNSDVRELIGKESVVVLRSGKTYVKTLNPGTAPHLFHLTSFNGPAIFDAEVVRVARIAGILPT